MNKIKISDGYISKGELCFVISDTEVDYNGNTNLVKRFIGADAVKFHNFVAEEVFSVDMPKAKHQRETADAEKSKYDIIKKLERMKHNFKELVGCTKKDIQFLSSSSSSKCVDFLGEIYALLHINSICGNNEFCCGNILSVTYHAHIPLWNAYEHENMLVYFTMSKIFQTMRSKNGK